MCTEFVNLTNENLEDDKMGELSKLPNIGKVVEKQLNQVGIKGIRRANTRS